MPKLSTNPAAVKRRQQRAKQSASMSPATQAKFKARRAAQQKARNVKLKQAAGVLEKVPKKAVDPRVQPHLDMLQTKGVERLPKLATVEQYFRDTDRLRRAVGAGEGWDWARQTDDVLAFIASNPVWTKETTRNAYRNALAAVLKHVEGFEDCAEAYRTAAASADKEVIQPEISNNQLRGTQDASYMEWDDLLGAVQGAPAEGSIESAVVAVYTLFPPRRLQDYRWMRVVADSQQPADANYLVVDADGEPVRFVFNVYKTSGRFGCQSFELGDELRQVLRSYLKDWRVAPDQRPWLFGTSCGTKPRQNMHLLVAKAFCRHTGRRVSCQVLRRSYVTHRLKTPQTIAAKEALAQQMAHSRQMQEAYQVIEAGGDAAAIMEAEE